MKTAIVTGATGFVGVHLVNELISQGVDVTALCRSESQNLNRLSKNIQIVFETDALKKADLFYHLAWDGASGPGRTDAALQVRNAEITLNMLTVAKTLGCSKFVSLGTIYEQFVQRIRENGKISGSDFYILGKEYAHTAAKRLALDLGIDFVWATVCHPIGRYIKPEQFMAYVIRGLVDGEKPVIGPATTLYDIIAVSDLAYGLYLLGKKNVGSDYFVGSGNPRLLYKYLEEAQCILEVQTPLGIGERPDDGLHFEYSWFDIAKLSADTGYAPRVDFSQAVLNVKNWVTEDG